MIRRRRRSRSTPTSRPTSCSIRTTADAGRPRGLTPQRAGEPALDRPRRAAARDDGPLAAPARLVQDGEQQVLDVEPRVAALDRLAHRLLEHLARARARRSGRSAGPATRAGRRSRRGATASLVMPHASSASLDRAVVGRAAARAAGGRSRALARPAAPPPPSRAPRAWRARPATTSPPLRALGARARGGRARPAWSPRATRRPAATTSRPRSPGRRARPRACRAAAAARATAVRPASGSPLRVAMRSSCASLYRPRLIRPGRVRAASAGVNTA